MDLSVSPERRNMVSARVPSHFNWPLKYFFYCPNIKKNRKFTKQAQKFFKISHFARLSSANLELLYGELRTDRQTREGGADKSLARPERKQARKHVWDMRDFNNIETRASSSFFFLQGKAPKEIHAILTKTLACIFLVGLRTYQYPCTKGRS